MFLRFVSIVLLWLRSWEVWDSIKGEWESKWRGGISGGFDGGVDESDQDICDERWENETCAVDLWTIDFDRKLYVFIFQNQIKKAIIM